MGSPRFLNLSEVLTILRDQITRYGGEFGVRDLGLVSSAIAVPQASFEGKRLHADLYEMTAAYAFHGLVTVGHYAVALTRGGPVCTI